MFRVPDDCNELSLPIPGLEFRENRCEILTGPPGWFSRKLGSSQGPLVSDYVTHAAGFEYENYGIHVGQDDRLTFMCDGHKEIFGSFIDCRKGSSSAGRRVEIQYAATERRHLVIPRGVAHTFDNLERVVTRDEPVLYSATANEDWNVDNDLVAFPRNLSRACWPTVVTNQLKLPFDAHLFVSRLSQTALRTPKRYLARHKVRIGGRARYVMLDASGWKPSSVPPMPDLKRLGVDISSSSHAQTGERSWTVVPSTDSCVSDVLFLDPCETCRSKVAHSRTRMIYTFLSGEGSDITIAFTDLRSGSLTFRESGEFRFSVDPRVKISIDPGVAYSFNSSVSHAVRAEHEVFVSDDEPRRDLMMFGCDLIEMSELSPGMSVPLIKCPGKIVYLMARSEVAAGHPALTARDQVREVTS